MCVNAPIEFELSDGVFSLNGSDYNGKLAEALLREQAPVIYADDVMNLLPDNNIERQYKESMKMVSAPRAIPPFNRMFVEFELPETLRGKNEFNKYGKETKPIRFMGASVDLNSYASTPNLAANLKRDCLLTMCSQAADTRVSGGKRTAEERATGTIYAPGVETKEQIEAFRFGHAETKKDVLCQFCVENGIDPSGDEIDNFLTGLDLVVITGFYSRGGTKAFGPWGGVHVLLDRNKKVMKFDEEAGLSFFGVGDMLQEELPHGSNFSEQVRQQIYYNSLRLASVVIHTISLLNCSNVRLVETGKTNSDIGRKRRDHDRLAMIRHHELRVKVGSQILRVDGRSETGQALVPLHMVRGHFRDYSEGKGLFGKYKGEKYNAVWVPPYARGSIEDGIVTRDYVLQPGDKEE